MLTRLYFLILQLQHLSRTKIYSKYYGAPKLTFADEKSVAHVQVSAREKKKVLREKCLHAPFNISTNVYVSSALTKNVCMQMSL